MLERSGGINCFYDDVPDEPLHNLWMNEQAGWRRVECVLDSGASENVAPPSMAQNWPIQESPGSQSGLHYTGANGGRMPNMGQQVLPVQLENGMNATTIFQIAEVTRPLVSVARLTSMGNEVIFGVSGGIIRNLKTKSEMPFKKKDGVYVFVLWIEPKGNNSQGFMRQP